MVLERLHDGAAALQGEAANGPAALFCRRAALDRRVPALERIETADEIPYRRGRRTELDRHLNIGHRFSSSRAPRVYPPSPAADDGNVGSPPKVVGANAPPS